MGRVPIASNQRRRPLAFALNDNELAFLDVYAEERGLDNRSAALRHMLWEMETRHSNGEVRAKLSIRRAELGRQARAEVVEEKKGLTRCPSCGEVDLFVPLRDDKWRCDGCGSRG